MIALLNRYARWLRRLLFGSQTDVLKVDRVDVAFAFGITACVLFLPVLLVLLLVL